MEECVVLSLNGNLLGTQKELIICFFVYISRGVTIYSEETGYNGIEVLESKLNQIAQRYPDVNILLAGDFNARCGENQDIRGLFKYECKYLHNFRHIYASTKWYTFL